MASYQEEKMDAITDNLANSATPGYRKSIAIQRPFDSILGDNMRDISSTETVNDFTQGGIRNTSRPLDFAIEGKGFFVLQNNKQDYYSRNGVFCVDADGNLTTTSGMKVMAVNGTISIPAESSLSKLTVSTDGTLKMDDQDIGKLRIVELEDTKQLIKIEPTLFKAKDTAIIKEATDSRVYNQSLEGSNALVFEEMADLITCTRANEICQKMIKLQDMSEEQLIRQII